jgi:methylthioribose-1-phosphate isomerase
MPRPSSIRWIGDLGGRLEILDQRALPIRIEWLVPTSVAEVYEAIKTLAVRGAPAIGIVSAYGLVLALRAVMNEPVEMARKVLRIQAAHLQSSRPTAVNLTWALRRVLSLVAKSSARSSRELAELILVEARAIHAEDEKMCRAMAQHGVQFVRPNMGILTHCNTGSLATGGEGTALGVIYEAQRRGLKPQVFADETRPLLQGARLTAWELTQEGIDATLITDSTAGLVMRQGKVQLVLVGADRIAANGDTANKIGTDSVAVLAAHHGIPLVVCAPSSTFDLALANGRAIPIEERSRDEIVHGMGVQTAPDEVRVFNPAFDVTPGELIHAIVTEHGVIQPVNEWNIRANLAKEQAS